MKKFIIGTILLFIELCIIVVGITCGIIGIIMQTISPLKEYLILAGFVGIGSFLGAAITFAGIVLFVLGIDR